METHRPRFRYLRLLIGGIAVILSSTAGIAGLMGWLPAATGGSGDMPAPGRVPVSATRAIAPQVESEARARGRCAECGVVVSMREIDAHDEGVGDASGGAAAGNPDELRVTAARRYEITIRMADRSSRVINHAGPASWRPGEHVIVIGGTNASSR
jgi:hypothetical protein